jgi:hypothetical protein
VHIHAGTSSPATKHAAAPLENMAGGERHAHATSITALLPAHDSYAACLHVHATASAGPSQTCRPCVMRAMITTPAPVGHCCAGGPTSGPAKVTPSKRSAAAGGEHESAAPRPPAPALHCSHSHGTPPHPTTPGTGGRVLCGLLTMTLPVGACYAGGPTSSPAKGSPSKRAAGEHRGHEAEGCMCCHLPSARQLSPALTSPYCILNHPRGHHTTCTASCWFLHALHTCLLHLHSQL